MSKQIEKLKRQLRNTVLAYRGSHDDLDCGANMAAVLRPRVYELAKQANSIAIQLKAIDPDFPDSWVAYPEGR